MLRFLPKEEKFFTMLADAASNINEAAAILKLIVSENNNLENNAKKIKELEHKGDQLTHEIINKLNQTFVTPFDREDIFSLTKALDNVIDYIDSAATQIVMYQLSSFSEEIKQLTKIITNATSEIQQGINKLDRIKEIYPHCIEINRLENEADAILRTGLVNLFSNNTDPITIIKLKDFYENLELATDMCEDVANVLEAIYVKNQ